jgi:Xaa-Pro aminopeptidase
MVYRSGEVEVFDAPEHKQITAKGAVQIDPKTCPQAFLQKFAQLQIIEAVDPCLLSKAIKNSAEIDSIKAAHNIDGRALTVFLTWLKNEMRDTRYEITELEAAQKLEEFRKQNPEYIAPSFTTISGFGSNGAIVHYSVSRETNKKFTPNNLFLLDSGGQYCGKKACGTTDVTRTIAIGQPSAEMRHDYTLVLKGHIAVATAEFAPSPENGADLDKLARQFLRAEGKDYDHGTGHGVGHFLSVHEGPCGISPRTKTPLAAGMVVSNEPGYYKAGEYGIRIENLVLVVARGDKLGFETLTKAPFDEGLIEWEILTDSEKHWIKAYHEQVFANI